MRGYAYETEKGVFHLLTDGSRWVIWHDGESYGSYHSAEAAADDLSGGHVPSLPDGTDTGDLDIPYDLADWVRI